MQIEYNEWFTDFNVQSKVYSIITEIEKAWIGPCVSSQLKLISCEKEQPEK
jgi:hypothetical protein